jgi:hypothetical protein
MLAKKSLLRQSRGYECECEAYSISPCPQLRQAVIVAQGPQGDTDWKKTGRTIRIFRRSYQYDGLRRNEWRKDFSEWHKNMLVINSLEKETNYKENKMDHFITRINPF